MFRTGFGRRDHQCSAVYIRVRRAFCLTRVMALALNLYVVLVSQTYIPVSTYSYHLAILRKLSQTRVLLKVETSLSEEPVMREQASPTRIHFSSVCHKQMGALRFLPHNYGPEFRPCKDSAVVIAVTALLVCRLSGHVPPRAVVI